MEDEDKDEDEEDSGKYRHAFRSLFPSFSDFIGRPNIWCIERGTDSTIIREEVGKQEGEEETENYVKIFL
ncbi:unnamed protein product [Soboliphyme baturini]|uniref:Ovule protein n=1 Tax=Soboliphyme baturini TaxID=241478 RepID=A0A183IZ45_9BILA|nr:unnamed protein product [Soboliphyme baturini]